MQLKYPTIGPWLAHKKRLIADDFDDLNLVTGREGKGKSTWAIKVAHKLDPTFTLKRLHFDWDPYQAQLATLERGQAIILDEFRGHSRESMTKQRMGILDEFKENRGLGIHHFLVFNRATKVDKDLLTDRVSDFSYIRRRGLVEIRQPQTELTFDWHGEMMEPTRYPEVARFRYTGKLPNGWRQEYLRMKHERMRDRRTRSRDSDAQTTAPIPRIPQGILDMVLKEAKRL